MRAGIIGLVALAGACAHSEPYEDPAVANLMSNEYGAAVVLDVGTASPRSLTFLFDTGAGMSVIDAAAADGLDLQFVREVNVSGGSDARASAGLYLTQLRLGEMVSSAQPILVMDLRSRGGPFEDGVDGIFGPRSLQGPMQVNLRDHAVTPAQIPASAGVPFRGEQNGVPVAMVRLGEVEFDAIIDTGSADFLALPADWIDRFALEDEPRASGGSRNVAGESEVRSARLADPLWVAGETFANADVTFVEDLETPLLGREALAHFRIILDYQGNRSWLFAQD